MCERFTVATINRKGLAIIILFDIHKKDELW